MKKIVSLLMTSVLCVGILAGCGTKETSNLSVSTDGSTSMEKVIGSLGEVFQEETGISFTFNPTGSGSGIKAVGEGRCDIGLSSRDLKAEEVESDLDRQDLVINMTEIVYPYLRAAVSALTANSFINPLILPVIPAGTMFPEDRGEAPQNLN